MPLPTLGQFPPLGELPLPPRILPVDFAISSIPVDPPMPLKSAVSTLPDAW